MIAPVFDTTSTLPGVKELTACCATTMMLVSEADETFAITPSSLTVDTDAPPPRRPIPCIVTRVPTVPLFGVTDVIDPAVLYWKAVAVLFITAPDDKMISTEPFFGMR